jgi:hypothetical protein
VQDDGPRVLTLGHLGELRALEDHQPGQPSGDAHEGDHQERGQDEDPRA